MTAVETGGNIVRPAIPAKRVNYKGKVAVLRRARKDYTCRQCEEPIRRGEQYYSVTQGGGGLGWLKFPDRVHILCLPRHLYKEDRDEDG